jgi:hypothetical protein
LVIGGLEQSSSLGTRNLNPETFPDCLLPTVPGLSVSRGELAIKIVAEIKVTNHPLTGNQQPATGN